MRQYWRKGFSILLCAATAFQLTAQPALAEFSAEPVTVAETELTEIGTEGMEALKTEQAENTETEGSAPEAAESVGTEIGAPETEAAEGTGAVSEVPETEIAESAGTETGAPETGATEDIGTASEVPETEAAESAGTETVAPETEAAEDTGAASEVPETEAAESAGTESDAPETEAAEDTGAVSEAPETEAAESAGTESSAPETEMTESSAPENVPGDEIPDVGIMLMMSAPAQNKQAVKSTVDQTRPVITITPVNDHYKDRMYCDPPAISVHDAGGNLVSVTAVSGDTSIEGVITNGSDCTLSIERQDNTTWTVTAKDDAGNEASEKFYVGHLPAGRQIVETAPTCTKNGTRTAYSFCSNCGEQFIWYTSAGAKALGHEADKAKPQQITLCGDDHQVITVYPCIRCQALMTEDGVVYDAQDGGHTWETKKEQTSCDQEGRTYEECSRCHITRNVETIPAGKHSYEAWKITKEADCGAGTAGERERTCKVCGAKETQQIAPDHIWSERVELKAATCTEAGYTGFKCTVCGRENEEHHIEIAALGHSYDDDGDCTTESVCSREGCGQKLPATQHSWGEYASDSTGHWQKCSNEGCTKTTKDINGAAEPHKNAPENGDCTSSWNCPDCGYEVRGYSSHTFDGTWKTDGIYHWQECSREGCSYQRRKDVHTGRDDGDCTTAVICTTCKATIREAETHKWSESYTQLVNIHRRRCTNPGCNQSTDVGDHTFTKETGDCTKAMICEECGYVAIHGESAHRFANAAYHGDESGHWQVCTNKNCQITSKTAAHTGGTATCRDRAVCELCRTPYGDVDAQNHVGGTEIVNQKAATEEEEGYTGDEICLSCQAVVKAGEKIPKLEKPCPHNWETRYDDLKSWEQCTLCDATQNEKAHTFTKWQSDGENHWQQCEYCEHTTHTSPHALDTAAIDKDCTTPVTCKDCGYLMIPAKEHAFGSDWAYDEDGHWHVCTNDDCEQTSEEIPHNAEDDGDCTTPVICKDCGHTVKESQAEHDWSSDWKQDEKGHYHVCENADCTQRQYEEHEAAEDDGLCTTPIVCKDCGWVMQEGAAAHDFGDYTQYQSDETGHWHVCQTPGCTGRSQETAHSGGKATCEHPAVCEVCGQSYGKADPQNHDGGEEIRDYEAPTKEKPGYSGDTYCLGCGGMISGGHMLDRLPEDHEHVFEYNKEHGIYASDDAHHWLECSCGLREEVQEHTYGELQKDPTHHWDTCKVCGRIWREEHLYENGKCTRCGAEQPKHEHEFTWHYTEGTHWQECGECMEKTEAAAHSGGTATCAEEAVCTDCGQAYGAKDPANHTGKTELRGQKEATAKEAGYTGDTYCLDCGQMIASGTVIPALGEPETEQKPEQTETETVKETETESESESAAETESEAETGSEEKEESEAQSTETADTQASKAPAASQNTDAQKAPATGDETPLLPLLAALLLSAAVFAAACEKRRRRL